VTVFASSVSDCDRPWRVICYGDSNTAGYHNKGRCFEPYGQCFSADLANAGIPNEVAVCGLCSFTTQDMLNERSSELVVAPIGPTGRGLAHILDEDGPADLVIIMTGTNDLGMQMSPETVVQHVAQLHGLCHERGVQTVVVAPTQSPGRNARRLRQRLSELLAAWAAKTPGVIDFIDVEDLVPRPCGKTGKAHLRGAGIHWEPDGLHLSAAGSQELGRRLASHAAAWCRTGLMPGCGGVQSGTPRAMGPSASSPAVGVIGYASPVPGSCAPGSRTSLASARSVGFLDVSVRTPTSCALTACRSTLRCKERARTVPTFGMLAL
jgi:lysophospholipase L1-like esterase